MAFFSSLLKALEGVLFAFNKVLSLQWVLGGLHASAYCSVGIKDRVFPLNIFILYLHFQEEINLMGLICAECANHPFY